MATDELTAALNREVIALRAALKRLGLLLTGSELGDSCMAHGRAWNDGCPYCVIVSSLGQSSQPSERQP